MIAMRRSRFASAYDSKISCTGIWAACQSVSRTCRSELADETTILRTASEQLDILISINANELRLKSTRASHWGRVSSGSCSDPTSVSRRLPSFLFSQLCLKRPLVTGQSR